MRVVETFSESRSLSTGRVGLVPTMGFLHEGHLSHIHRARETSDTVVVSLFVNPLQFEDEADLDRYPRDVGRDAALASAAGADVLFAPPTEEMYPDQPLTRVTVAHLADHMEGPRRPGHFDGVATVVAKLLAGLRPDTAHFGRKDAQQLAVVTRMAFDLSLPTQIVPGPTVREADGLALSSRNIFLSEGERGDAVQLSSGLFAAADAIESGVVEAAELHEICRAHLSGIDVEYVQLASQALAEPLRVLAEPSFLALAATIGSTRLIDNVAIDFDGAHPIVDRGIRLERPSLLYSEA